MTLPPSLPPSFPTSFSTSPPPYPDPFFTADLHVRLLHWPLSSGRAALRGADRVGVLGGAGCGGRNVGDISAPNADSDFAGEEHGNGSPCDGDVGVSLCIVLSGGGGRGGGGSLVVCSREICEEFVLLQRREFSNCSGVEGGGGGVGGGIITPDFDNGGMVQTLSYRLGWGQCYTILPCRCTLCSWCTVSLELDVSRNEGVSTYIIYLF